ncbi:MAG: hypothetical protein IH587_05360 [Anaerolineae bacterium]|nr:hypothetical protein [Anaerolineae bacterium]
MKPSTPDFNNALIRRGFLGTTLADETDRLLATGAIVEKDGVLHVFYSTQNRADRGPGLAHVRVDTSRDCVTWTKPPGMPLLLLKRPVSARKEWKTLKMG